MSERVEMWKTNDGKVWETECAAERHETRTTAESTIRILFYNGMVEDPENLIDFLDTNKTIILRFYGIEIK